MAITIRTHNLLMPISISVALPRFLTFWFAFSVLLSLEVSGQSMVPEKPAIREFPNGFLYGGNASVGTAFFGGRAGEIFASPFSAKGGLSLAWNEWSFEASAAFLNGRQKTDFQLNGKDYSKNDRYTIIGAQTSFGYWIRASDRFVAMPFASLSYHYAMPGNTELSDSRTRIQGQVGMPGAGIFMGYSFLGQKGETDAPHIEIMGLRYEVIWPGFTGISGPMHQISFSITGLLGK